MADPPITGAPMFARAIATSSPCLGCKEASRVLADYWPLERTVRLDAIAPIHGSGLIVRACRICDQNPIDAPTWTHRRTPR